MDRISAWLSNTNVTAYEQVGLSIVGTAIAGAAWWLLQKAMTVGRRGKDYWRFEDRAVDTYLREGPPAALMTFLVRKLANMVVALVSIFFMTQTHPSSRVSLGILVCGVSLLVWIFWRAYSAIVVAYFRFTLDPAVKLARAREDAEGAQAPKPEV